MGSNPKTFVKHTYSCSFVDKIELVVICYGIMASNVLNFVGPQVNLTIFVPE
jgi:hypothetical protein